MDPMRTLRLDRLAKSMGGVEIPAPPALNSVKSTPLKTKPLSAKPLAGSQTQSVKLKNGQIVEPGAVVRLHDGRRGTVKSIGPSGITIQGQKKR